MATIPLVPTGTWRDGALRVAIRRTLAYAAVFDAPLTAHEVHRYLHGERASAAAVREALASALPDLCCRDGLYAPADRAGTLDERRRRRAASAAPLARARAYGLILRHLPFVRMIGITGSLAMGNPAAGEVVDIDLLIVAAPGRVWLCRAFAIALVRAARLAGDTLCPNYLISERALAFEDDSLYAAHELAQMIPIYGRAIYLALWAANPQTRAWLPNATPRRTPHDRLLPGTARLKRLAERVLGGAAGDRIERWERERKAARLRQRAGGSVEAAFSPDRCKGHFGGHRERTLAAYHERLHRQ